MYKNHNIGLDLFRTMAIALVLLSHIRHLFTYIEISNFNWWWLSVGGYLGVELFFVLSGFLIGNILIKELLFKIDNFKNLKRFFIRRWLRTLPLFFLLLIVYVIVEYIQKDILYIPYLHIVFLQNFDNDAIGFFAVAWSLSVEEWFYIIVPMVLLIFAKSYKSFLYTILLLFFLIIIYKSFYIYLNPSDNWTDIRKNIPFRFSSLLIGLFLSFIKYYHYDIFKKLNSNIFFLTASLILLCLVVWYYHKEQIGLDTNFFSKAYMFEATSVVLAIIMVRFYHMDIKNNIFIHYGSRYSYSIYLVHFLYLLPLINLSHQYKTLYISILLLFIFFLATITTSYILYKYFEKPILDYRESIDKRIN